MKKSSKIKAPKYKTERVVAYLDDDMLEWINKEAGNIRVSVGHIIRRMILEKMQSK